MRLLCLATVLVLAGCEVNVNSEGIVSRETKTFAVTGVPELVLDTFDGSIEVHSWDRQDVEIEIERRGLDQSVIDEMTVTAEQRGNRIEVKVSNPRRDRDFDGIQIGVDVSPTARLRVAVPRETQLTATSGDGSITVEDITGKISLHANNGSVRGSRVSGELEVRSGDGSIRLDRAEGKIDLETEDGSITLEAKPSALRARTTDGSIRVEVEADSEMIADWDLQTADGTVVVTLPSDFSGVIDAETRDGSVRTSHPAISTEERQGERRGDHRRTLQATLGSGGKTIRVRTGDGSIRIE